MKKVIPTGFDIRIREGAGNDRAVVLDIHHHEGTETVFVQPDYAEELGFEFLAAALRLNGRLHVND